MKEVMHIIIGTGNEHHDYEVELFVEINYSTVTLHFVKIITDEVDYSELAIAESFKNQFPEFKDFELVS